MTKIILSEIMPSKSSSDSANEVLRVFHLYKKQFISYMLKNHSIDEETLEDIYQESFLVLYQDIRSGKLQDVKLTSLKSYLFRVGINKTLKYFEQQRKSPMTNIDELPELMDTNDFVEWEKKQEVVSTDIFSKTETGNFFQ